MKRYFIIGFFCLMFTASSHSQDYYHTAVGVRLGLGPGLTVKHFLNHTNALEGIVSLRWRGFMVTALYEKESVAFNTPGLNWFVGGGAHIGFWGSYYDSNPWWDYDNNQDGYTIIGADFILGMEYTFEYIPLNLSLDWKPAINFIGYTGFWGDFIAFSIRYAFF